MNPVTITDRTLYGDDDDDDEGGDDGDDGDEDDEKETTLHLNMVETSVMLQD